MKAFYAERFERDVGCTEADWLRWLPQALGEHPWELRTGTAGVRIGDGALGQKWQVAAPRATGRDSIPVLGVRVLRWLDPCACFGYCLSRLAWQICGAASKLHSVAAEPVFALGASQACADGGTPLTSSTRGKKP